MNEADRTAARIRRLQAEYFERPEPITPDELDDAIAYARRVRAPDWLIRLLESHRRDDAAGIGR